MQANPDTVTDLAELYQRELQPILGELEQQRLQVRNRSLVGLAVAVPVAGLLAALLGSWIGLPGVIFPLFFGFMGWMWFSRTASQEYRHFFKAQVIARLAHLVDPTLVYQQQGGISITEFRASRLFRSRIDRYRAEDLFTGQVGATAFRFSEVHAQYKTTTTDSKGRRRTTWHTIFRGIYFIADFNKHFQGYTFVLPDNAESFGGIGRWFQELGSKMDGRPGELVRLEDPEFERLFAVQSTDQIEARYILSTSLMQRLMTFRNEVDAPVSIAFVDSNIFIAISTRKNYFEPPSIWRSAAYMDQADVEAYFADVRLAEQIVEELNLNLRIWTKQ
jgi:hypothetical protein